jgi:ferric-dicitrate binding protein FerR (iron transport regulator)
MNPLEHATHVLRGAVADPGDVEAMPPDREAAVARIAEALRARARARRRKRMITGLAIAAGIGALATGGVFAAHRASSAGGSVQVAHGGRDLGRVEVPSEGLTALREGHAEPLGAGARVAEGTELRTTGTSQAHLDFDSGTRVTLGGAARLRLVEQSQRKRFALESGSFFAKVAKLGPEERFVVTTPDAEVEVRGTAFRVTIVEGNAACAGGTPTRLDVSEGVVVVRHAGTEVRVAAGERWPACDPAPAGRPASASANAPPAGAGTAGTTGTEAATTTAPDTIAVGPGPAVTGARPGTSGAATHAASPSPEASSRLAEQNDLFESAMRLKRSGDTAGAQAKLDRLLASYPGGPVAESAEVERMRLLAASNRPRGVAAAREYLRRHPNGFARAEAEAIAAQ